MPYPLCTSCNRQPTARGTCCGCREAEKRIQKRRAAGQEPQGPGHGLRVASRGRPAEPTNALPGTAGKVAAMEERARLGLDLWHPDDAGGDLE
jgi:hypothetical protein